MSTTTLRVGGVPEHFNLPWKLALESGDFAAAGIALEFSDYPGGTGAMNRALREDQLDVALLLSAGGLAEIVNADISRLVKVYVASPLLWGIHVAAAGDIHTVDAIEGRRYAISRPGSGSQLTAIVDASLRGWPSDALRFVTVGGLDGARSALANGEADIFFWERFTTQPYVDAGEFRRVGERETPWPAFMVSVRKTVLAKRSDEIRRMLTIVDAHSKTLSARTDAVELIAERYALDPVETANWYSMTRWQQGFERPDAALGRILEALEMLSLIGSDPVDLDDIWQRL